MVSQVCDVECRSVLRVCGAKDVTVCVKGEEVCQVASDGGEVRDNAVVHEDVTAENKRVGIDLSHDAAAACANMSKDAMRLGVFAQRLEVEIVDGWTLRLVKCWTRANYALNV